MRKVIASELITLDGFIAGPGGELDWLVRDQEHKDFSKTHHDVMDTIIFGRRTYEEMNSWWPTAEAAEDEPETALMMNTTSKLVFSKTLDRVEWNNARLAEGEPGPVIRRLKEQPGQNMVILGSGTIVSQLAEAGLIDEYRLFVHPVMLGSGRPLLPGLAGRLNLKLLRTETSRAGIVTMILVPQETAA